MIQLRPLHLICIIKYRGKNYREDFIPNLKKLLTLATGQNADRIQVFIGADSICDNCELNKSNKCMKDSYFGNDALMKNERELIKLMSVEGGHSYDIETLFDIVDKDCIEKNLFDHIHCDSCIYREKCVLYKGLME